MTFIHRTTLLVWIAALAVPIAAGAQTIVPPEQSPAVPGTPPGCPDASGRDTGHSSTSCGVIVPPPTGDRVIKPAPNSGSMPVIPPPGTPGSGNENVQPR